jgi:hypothetical protein
MSGIVPGWNYGIDAVTKGTNESNFVVNQGTDRDVNVRAYSMALTSGTTLTLTGSAINIPSPVSVTSLNAPVLTTANLASQSSRLAGVSFAAAAVTPVFDFSSARNIAAFGGRYCQFQIGDGAGSSTFGYVLVSATGQLSDLVHTTSGVTAPVTAVAVTIATSILSVSFTGKTATTGGSVFLTSCTN